MKKIGFAAPMITVQASKKFLKFTKFLSPKLLIYNKKCPKCNKLQPLKNYTKNKASKDKRSFYCKSCYSTMNKLTYKKTKHKRQTPEFKAKKALNDKNYKLKNYKKIKAKKRAEKSLKRSRQPNWLSKTHKSAIKNIYLECQKVTKETQILHHVDHIIPLNSKIVSGLHVPWNLQIIPASANIKKSNHLRDSE